MEERKGSGHPRLSVDRGRGVKKKEPCKRKALVDSVQIDMLTLWLYHEPDACWHITQDQSSKGWKQTGPEESLFVEENCTGVLCLSTGEGGRIVGSSI